MLLAITAAVALAGCGTVDTTDAVAVVDGTEIPQSDFEPLAEEFFDRGELFGTNPPIDGRVDGDNTRLLLGLTISQQVFRALLDDQGVDVESARAEYRRTNFPEGSPGSDLSDEMIDLLIDSDVPLPFRPGVLAEIQPPSTDELEAMYDADPASTGMLCLRHILVETEGEADDVLAALDDGADFAELAEERSTDPSASGNGGAISGGANDCVPVQTLQQGFDPAFTAAALEGTPGVPSEPVESSFGWHVILHRPWSEISASVVELHAPGDSGGYLLDGAIATADVDVDPRFGVWNPAANAVVALD